jgi:hypothetical protein
VWSTRSLISAKTNVLSGVELQVQPFPRHDEAGLRYSSPPRQSRRHQEADPSGH